MTRTVYRALGALILFVQSALFTSFQVVAQENASSATGSNPADSLTAISSTGEIIVSVSGAKMRICKTGQPVCTIETKFIPLSTADLAGMAILPTQLLYRPSANQFLVVHRGNILSVWELDPLLHTPAKFHLYRLPIYGTIQYARLIAGDRLLTINAQGQVYMTELSSLPIPNNKQSVQNTTEFNGQIQSIALFPLEAAQMTPAKKYWSYPFQVTQAASSQTGKQLAFVSGKTSEGELIQLGFIDLEHNTSWVHTYNEPVSYLSMSDDGTLVATRTSSGKTSVFSNNKGAQLFQTQNTSDAPCLAILPETNTLALCNKNQLVLHRIGPTTAQTRPLALTGFDSTTSQFVRYDKFLYAINRNGSLVRYNTDIQVPPGPISERLSSSQPSRSDAQTNSPSDVIISSDGSYAVSVQEGDLRAIRFTSDRKTIKIPHKIRPVAFSAKGIVSVAKESLPPHPVTQKARSNEYLVIRDPKTAKLLFSIPHIDSGFSGIQTSTVSLSPNGKYLMVANDSCRATIYGPSKGKKGILSSPLYATTVLGSSENCVNAKFQFINDKKILALLAPQDSTAMGKSVILGWNGKSTKLEQEFPLNMDNTASNVSVLTSNDGKLIISSKQGTTYLVETKPAISMRPLFIQQDQALVGFVSHEKILLSSPKGLNIMSISNALEDRAIPYPHNTSTSIRSALLHPKTGRLILVTNHGEASSCDTQSNQCQSLGQANRVHQTSGKNGKVILVKDDLSIDRL